MAHKGETWNESETYRDARTLRQVRRVTTRGLYNITPTYHTNSAFTADGEYLIFRSARQGKSAVFSCHAPSGDITQLIESVDGVGHRVLGDGSGVDRMCVAAGSGWVVYAVNRSLHAVHIETLEERILIPHIAPEWMASRPSVSHDGKSVLLPVQSEHPDGLSTSIEYHAYFAEGGMKTQLWKVPLEGGEVKTIYSEEGLYLSHVAHCPTDSDLVLANRNHPGHIINYRTKPPRTWPEIDDAPTRIWTLRLSTGELTELKARDRANHQVHSAWTWDGQCVVYHGKSVEGGYFIGVIGRDGKVMQECGFHKANSYGHVSAMAGRPAIILDGNLTSDMLLWLYYDDEQPRVEMIAQHNTNWGALPGQFPHPHPLADPTGRWISFNAGDRGRSDVYVVSV